MFKKSDLTVVSQIHTPWSQTRVLLNAYSMEATLLHLMGHPSRAGFDYRPPKTCRQWVLWQMSCELSSEKALVLSDPRGADFSQSCSRYGLSD